MNDATLLAGSLTALAAGVLSFLSPCVLPLMPAYLSFVSGLSIHDLRDQREPGAEVSARSGRVLVGSLGFIGGFSAVFVAIGASASVIGQIVTGLRFQILGWVFSPAQIAGVVIVFFGLHLVGVLRIPFLYREQRFAVAGGGSVLRAFLLGGAFAFGWTPCIGPILAGILTLAAGQETVGRGVFLLSLYSLGLGVPFLLMALSLNRFYTVFDRLKRHFKAIEIASGVLLIGVGVLVAMDQLVALNSYFAFMNEFVIGLEQWLQ